MFCVGPLSELKINKPVKTVLPSGEKIAVVRTSATDVHAISDQCPHRDVSLSKGKVMLDDIEDLVGDTGQLKLKCKKHKRKFGGDGLYIDLATGKTLARPCAEWDPSWRVDVYTTMVDDKDVVYVSLDPAPAVPSTGGAAAAGAGGASLVPVAVATTTAGAAAGSAPSPPSTASALHPWTLESRTQVSADSFVFHLRRPPTLPSTTTTTTTTPTTPTTTTSPTEGVKSGGDDDVCRWHCWHVWLAVTPSGPSREYTPVSTFDAYTSGTMHILIKIYPEGKLTPLLAGLADRSPVLVSRPELTLTLPDVAVPRPLPAPEAPPISHLVLVCGGTGVTPVLQLLELATNTPKLFPALRSVTVLTSNHTEIDVLGASRLATIEATHASLVRVRHTLTAVTRDPASPASTSIAHYRGRVNAEMCDWLLSASATDDDAGSRVRTMLCGPDELMEATERLLTARGLHKSEIVCLDA